MRTSSWPIWSSGMSAPVAEVRVNSPRRAGSSRVDPALRATTSTVRMSSRMCVDRHAAEQELQLLRRSAGESPMRPQAVLVEDEVGRGRALPQSCSPAACSGSPA